VLPVVGLCAALLCAAPAGAAGGAAARPVVIVEDGREIRRAVGFAVEGTFTPSQEEAEAPRRDLARHLESELAREKDRYRRAQLGRISAARDRYLWHCGGYTKNKERYLFCTFVLGWPEKATRKEFPEIADGGTSVCRCTYRLKAGKIAELEWNGEA
jgi:hypothetical protein